MRASVEAPVESFAPAERVARRFAMSVDVPHRFFEAHAEAISLACLALARRFEQGGRLLIVGLGAQASDAEHVAVEFVHPVLVGKRALPAIAITGEPTAMLARVAALGESKDIVMTIDLTGNTGALLEVLTLARSRGMLTIALTGGDGGALHSSHAAEHLFVVEANDPMVIQETHETLYHVLWELVHLFFEQQVAR